MSFNSFAFDDTFRLRGAAGRVQATERQRRGGAVLLGTEALSVKRH